ncbi:MAG TPA: GIY-YIG nuclease family protein, partial [Dokdonella sp.]|nr:GIY-YIG nuclease family protein [Dokdonella sp.]
MNGFAGELTVRNWFDMPVEPWTVRGLPCGMAFYLYMLRCADGSYYTGHSDDPDRRVHEHHEGLIPGCYTHDRRPLLLVHVQEFGSREDALAAEVQVKRWSRAKKEALIAQDWDALRLLARAKGAGESVHGSTGSPRTELLGSSPQTGGSTGSRRTELAGGSTGSPRTELAGGSTGSPRTGRS